MVKIHICSCLLAMIIIFHVSELKSQPLLFSEFAPATRSIAMGNTASSSFSDAASGYLNPATIINARKITASLFYSSPTEQAEYKSLGFTIPVHTLGSLGFGYYKMDSKIILSSRNNVITTEAFAQHYYIFSFARTLFRTIAVGMNAKYMMSGFPQDNSSYNYSGIDIGIQYQPVITNSILSNSTIGVSVDNLIQLTKPIGSNKDLLKYYRIILEKKVLFGDNVIQFITNLALKEEYSNKNENSLAPTKETSRLKVYGGIEYERGPFCLRLGQAAANSLSGGVGIRLKSLNIGYAHGRVTPEGLQANSFSISFEY